MSSTGQTTGQQQSGAGASETASLVRARPAWRDIWQLPALAGSLIFLVGGLVVAVMSSPKPDAGAALAAAERMVEKSDYSGALDVLNAKVLPLMTGAAAKPEDLRRFHVLRARALYLGQKELNIDREENNRAIAFEYEEAERHNASLDARDTGFLAHTVVSLGDLNEATRRLGKLPESAAETRIELLKRMIQICIAAPERESTRALDLITLLTADPTLSTDDRLWALSKQTAVLVTQGFSQEAITKVLRTLPRLENAAPELLGEILVHLARAYLAENDTREAAKHLGRAAELLSPENRLMASVTLLQGEIEHRSHNLGSAADRYGEVVERFSFSDELAPALLGLAEVKAESVHAQENGQVEAVGSGLTDPAEAIDQSLDHYSQLVDMVVSGGANPSVTRERVGRSLLARFREQFDRPRPDHRRALRFASLGERLFGVEAAPADLVLALAEVNRRLAEEMLHVAGEGGVLSLADADPATQREARAHLIRAGEYFREHAAKVVESDARAYGDSLWRAADSFDRAGDLDASINAFQQFANDFPSDDRVGEARFRLAQAYQARGDLELAAAIYREQVGAHSGGEFADRCHVPLAQTLLADADPANDAEAEGLLNTVISGALGGTGTTTFRAALRELGRLHYRSGQYARAIERLEEFLQREELDHGDEPRANWVSPHLESATSAESLEATRYKLADSYRLSGASIEETLRSGAMPDGERRDLELSRVERLKRAEALFEQVRRALESQRRRTALEDLYLRNAYFYLGDCAFDLKDYETAIRRYDAARERYAKDPASLVAMTQIVSAHLAQGDTAKAAVANTRAKRFFESLPETVWEDPTLPMTRSDWEHWLDSQSALAKLASGKEPGPE